ncbi:hypothetical protein, partial [Elstera litoralis]|uniref:hypothetical protein n=1 Tax=Elstera litoralis TaxID=552518 RepID=UPI001E320877
LCFQPQRGTWIGTAQKFQRERMHWPVSSRNPLPNPPGVRGTITKIVTLQASYANASVGLFQ